MMGDPELDAMVAEPRAHVPPHDLDAEGAVLGSLLDGSHRLDEVLSTLRPTYFYSDANRRIYEAIVGLDADGTSIDLVTVATRLRDAGRLEQVGGSPYLVQLTDAPCVVDLTPHAERIVETWARRRVHEVCSITAIEARDGARPMVELVADLSESLTRITKPSDRGPQLPRLDADAIFARLTAVPWLIRGLDICPGAPTLIAGYGFSGKSVAMQSAAVSIAAGLTVWDCFAARRGRVLWCDFEQGEHLTRARFQRIAAALMITPDDLRGRLELVSMPGTYLDSAGAEDFWSRECEGVDTWIVDPFRAAAPTVEENASTARVPLDMMARVSARTGCTPIALHHTRKPQKDAAGGAKMVIRGSGAIFDACASVLCLDAEKGQAVRVSHEKARTSGHLAEDFELCIADVDVDGVPGAGLSVTASAAPSHEEREASLRESRDAQLDARVLEAVRTCPGQSGREIAAALHANQTTTIAPALLRLARAGLVEPRPGPRRAELWWPTSQEGEP
jgi:hypothetical protein